MDHAAQDAGAVRAGGSAVDSAARRRDDFVRAWIRRRQRSALDLVAALAVAVHAVSLACLPVVAHPSLRGVIALFHGLALALALFGMLRRDAGEMRRHVMTVLIAVTLAFYVGLLGYAARVLASPGDVLLASAGAVTYAVFGIQLYPGSTRSLVALVAVFVTGAAVATIPWPGGDVWSVMLAMVSVLLLVARVRADLALQREAQSEFRLRSLVAPADAVRRSLDSDESLLAAFRTEPKFCVCIASDWRDDEALSDRLSPSQLTMTLNEYYSLCARLLERCLPEGNYYADWIADELFIVLFAHGDMTDQRLIDAAMRFSAELIRAKRDFSRVHRLPRAVDIGVSAGTALLGLMGAVGHEKATALGPVSGRARCFQDAGKLLRLRHGAADRIVFGRECSLQIDGAHVVQTLELGVNESVRDFKDRELYFIEPTATDDEPRRGAA